MLTARLSFMNYRNDQSPEVSQELHERLDTPLAAIKKMDEVAQRDDVKTAIAGFSSQVETYREGFNAISRTSRAAATRWSLAHWIKLGPQLQEDIAAKITKELQSVFKTGAAFVVWPVFNMLSPTCDYRATSTCSPTIRKPIQKPRNMWTLHSAELVKVIGEASYEPIAERLLKRPEPILLALFRGDLRSPRDHQSAQRYHNGHA
jgi:hypothetical protein